MIKPSEKGVFSWIVSTIPVHFTLCIECLYVINTRTSLSKSGIILKLPPISYWGPINLDSLKTALTILVKRFCCFGVSTSPNNIAALMCIVCRLQSRNTRHAESLVQLDSSRRDVNIKTKTKKQVFLYLWISGVPSSIKWCSDKVVQGGRKLCRWSLATLLAD